MKVGQISFFILQFIKNCENILNLSKNLLKIWNMWYSLWECY
jgi:hypothetical protein